MLCDICSLLRASVFLFLWNIFLPATLVLYSRLAHSHFNSQMLHIWAASKSFLTLSKKMKTKRSQISHPISCDWTRAPMFRRQSQEPELWVDLLRFLKFQKSSFELSTGESFYLECRTCTTTIQRTVSMEPWVSMATVKWSAACFTSVEVDILMWSSLSRF